MQELTTNQLETFTASYIATALWSSVDDHGFPFDANYSEDDLAPETLAKMKADCRTFCRDFAILIREGWGHFEDEWRQAGHDFWLSRCGHGAGFWDGDWPEGVGEALDDGCKVYGDVDLYIGDDGKIYS